MLPYAPDLMGEAERRKDEMAQAKRHRLGHLVPKKRSSVMRVYQRLLARVGELLVLWGCQLQTRFALESGGSP
jgi:hypothetical protein